MLVRDRLILGTAQLTQPYGVLAGEAHRNEASDVIERALERGIRAFDTASVYGDAEQALGQARAVHEGLRVITKCAHLPVSAPEREQASLIERSARQSLERLGGGHLDVFLLHNMEAFDDGVARSLDRVRDLGLAAKVGASVYTREDIDHITADWKPDVIQVPVNLLDQRLMQDGSLQQLHDAGIELHARSAFLQGVLLSDPDVLPPRLDGLRARVREFQDQVGSHTVERAAACIGFLAQTGVIDGVIVGAQNVQQLEELVVAADRARAPQAAEKFAVDDPGLVDPRRWAQ